MAAIKIHTDWDLRIEDNQTDFRPFGRGIHVHSTVYQRFR